MHFYRPLPNSRWTDQSLRFRQQVDANIEFSHEHKCSVFRQQYVIGKINAIA